jgi:hypothetical protein
MMHIGELFVGAGEKKVDGKVEIVQEAGGQEVYEMAWWNFGEVFGHRAELVIGWEADWAY